MKGSKGLFSMGFTLAMVLFISGFSLPCFSQPPGEGRPRGPESPVPWNDESPQAIEKRKKVRERIALIRMWKLTEELDLTEETGAKLFPILRKYDEKWIGLQKDRRALMQQLRKALEDEATSDKEIEGAMERVETNAMAVSDLLRQQRQDLKGILSPRQQAKFILFQRQFQREIRRIIAEARQRKVKAKRDDRLKRD
ncbi:MAG: Spy/CpxP family protein refolding chaperone [Thermodesulfobacteriota bacterium]